MCRNAAVRVRLSGQLLAGAAGRSARLLLQGSHPSAPASAASGAGSAIGRCTCRVGHTLTRSAKHHEASKHADWESLLRIAVGRLAFIWFGICSPARVQEACLTSYVHLAGAVVQHAMSKAQVTSQGGALACRSATVSTQVGPSADTCTCSSLSRALCWYASPGRASTCDCPTCAPTKKATHPANPSYHAAGLEVQLSSRPASCRK